MTWELGSLAEVSRVVRERRKSLRLTQEDLADLADCSPRYVRSLESGKPTVRMDKLMDVLDVLGVEGNLRVRRPQ